MSKYVEESFSKESPDTKLGITSQTRENLSSREPSEVCQRILNQIDYLNGTDLQSFYYLISEKCINASRYADAKDFIQHALNLWPKAARFHFQSAHLAEKQSMWSEAIYFWQNHIELLPNRPTPYIKLANCYLKEGTPQKAQEVLEHALSYIENDAEIRKALSKIQEVVKNPSQDNFDSIESSKNIYTKVREALGLWDFETVSKLCERLEKELPTDGYAFLARAAVYQKQLMWSEALIDLDSFLEIHPANQEALIKKGRSLLEIHEFEVFNAFINQTDNLPKELEIMQIDSAMKQNQWDKVIDCSEQLLKKYPKNVAIYFKKALALIESGQFDQSRKVFKKTAELEPNRSRPLRGQVILCRRQRKGKEEPYLKSQLLITARASKDLADINEIAKLLINLNAYEEAKELIESCLLPEKAKNAIEQRLILVEYYCAIGALNKALTQIDELIEQSPQSTILQKKKVDILLLFRQLQPTLRAIEILEYLQSCVKDNKIFQITLSNAYIAAYEFTKAQRSIDSIPQKYNSLESVRVLRAWQAHYKHDYKLAKQWWHQICNTAFKPSLHANLPELTYLSELQLNPDDVVLFTCVKNEMLRLPYFLEYYRNLGVDKFFIVDNQSDDGSTDYLIEQKDICLVSIEGSYAEAGAGMRWVNELIERHTDNHWCLYIDPDELLIFADSENLCLKNLLGYMTKRDDEALFAFMLDMHPERLNQPYEKGTNFLEHSPYFNHKYKIQSSAHPPYTSVFGGFREAIFSLDASHLMTKTPIIRSGRGIKFISSSHQVSAAKLSDLTGVLLHFKFLGDFEAKAQEAVTSYERSQGGREYKKYLSKISSLEKNVNFVSNISKLYKGSLELQKLGLLVSSDSFSNIPKEVSGLKDFRYYSPLENNVSFGKYESNDISYFGKSEAELESFAWEAQHLENNSLAATYWQELRMMNPNSRPAYIQGANCYIQLKQYNAAKVTLSKCEATFGESREVFLAFARIALSQTDLELALSYCEKCLESFPDDPHALDLQKKIFGDYVQLLLTKKEYKKALKQINSATQSDIRLGLLKAKCLEALHRYDEAFEHYQALSENYSANTAVISRQASMLFTLKRYSDVIPLLTQLYEQTSNIQHLRTLMICFIELEQFDQFDQNIHLFELETLLELQAIKAEKLTNWSEAETLYNELISQQPNNLIFKLRMANLLLRQHNYDEAKSLYESLLDSSKHLEACRGLLHIYLLNFQLPLANQLFKRYENLHQDTICKCTLIEIHIKQGRNLLAEKAILELKQTSAYSPHLHILEAELKTEQGFLFEAKSLWIASVKKFPNSKTIMWKAFMFFLKALDKEMFHQLSTHLIETWPASREALVSKLQIAHFVKDEAKCKKLWSEYEQRFSTAKKDAYLENYILHEMPHYKLPGLENNSEKVKFKKHQSRTQFSNQSSSQFHNQQSNRPIDLVYTWVDDSDFKWSASKDYYLKKFTSEENIELNELQKIDNLKDDRYRTFDYLKFSLRSVEKYCNFYGKIYIVTSGQHPSWLSNHPKIEIIEHNSIFSNPNHIPTFHSQAIECHLDNIPNLSEHFLYFNDDFFLGQPIKREDFIGATGKLKLYADLALMKRGNSNALEGHFAFQKNTNALLDKLFQYENRYYMSHCPIMLKKSAFAEAKKMFSEAFEKTSQSRFRSSQSYSITNGLLPYYSYYTNKAELYIKQKNLVKLSSNLVENDCLLWSLNKRKPKFYAFTEDIDSSAVSAVNKQITNFLEKMYPEKSTFEL